LNRINRLQLWIFQFGKTQFDNSFVFNNRIFQLLIRIIVFTCCYGGLPLGAAALVTGYLGLKNASENPARFGGRGLAIGGIVTGVIGLLISIIFFTVLLAG